MKKVFVKYCLMLMLMVGINGEEKKIGVKVGVVLDIDKVIGKISSTCINISLSDFYAAHPHYKTRLLVIPRNSKTDVVTAAASALDLIKNVQVQAILGPENSMETGFVINLGNKSQVPIISFSATSPSLASKRSPYFIRATQSSSFQVKAIAAIVQAFGWREAVPIYVDNEFGESIIPYLTDALQDLDVRVPYRSVISPSATDDQLLQELFKLMTMQTRVFMVHLLPSLGSRIFSKAKEIGMMRSGYVWIMTDGMTNLMNIMDRGELESMQGVLGIKPFVPISKELEDFKVRWKKEFSTKKPSLLNAELNIFGLLAYDSAMALATAVENAGTRNIEYDDSQVSGNSSDLESFGISLYGPKLRQQISNIRFKGLTGDFHILNGQLQSLTYQIINVNGNEERGIGFWTPKNGFVKELNSTNSTVYSTSKANLGRIIWPGGSSATPKGFEIPTNGKRLRIGVPKKKGFSEFVEVTRDPVTNRTSVTGFCIDVFDAAMRQMPYDVSYDYFPFETPDGNPAGSYDELVNQVYLGNYDAVVGDTTILANRSWFVDFTLPYTDSGVSMVVSIKDNKEKHAWAFLTPLTWDLWVTSACFFVFIGFVIWVLEHRINEDFRGPLEHQVGTSFWFSFSTMVFAQRERVVSNLARFVMIIWFFVVLILTQSYTAGLTSRLTVQQLQPTVTSIDELLKKGENVGYQRGSFVLGILKRLGFNESKLIPYDSPEHCNALFSNGTAKNGIVAAFDEVPYMKVFLGKFCNKYTMIDPTFKIDGWGFVFPRRSPLVPDVSRAILIVTEGGTLTKIENAYFREQGMNCSEENNLVSSNSMDLNSFWGLFLIAGIASLSALLIFTIMFLYQHREVLMRSDSTESVWRRILVLLRIFNQRDLSSHTFKKCEDRSRSSHDHGLVSIEASPNRHCPPTPSTTSNNTRYPYSPSTFYNTNCPPSPSDFSNCLDSELPFSRAHRAPSHENGGANPNGQAPQEIVLATELTHSTPSTTVTFEITRENN
ncbi:glutamate receptor 2.7-like [Carica papaya]|uniref:glutamate receptor 2.7-like n=1 Tax=Carica papaya TaxID=3649 RepID=UPI000B8CA48A|nr:glutamate receptor 2.7-like [Carica papaya]